MFIKKRAKVAPSHAARIHGMTLALGFRATYWPGGFMAQSSTTSDLSPVETRSQHTRPGYEIGRGAITNESKAAAMMAQAKREPALKVSMATRWNEALCCEARNSLQVILSGAEIMLEDHLENLLVGQKDLLAKMTDNAYHLCNLLTALLGPEEFKLEETNEGRFRAVRRVPGEF
jgi:hypothetical protein